MPNGIPACTAALISNRSPRQNTKSNLFFDQKSANLITVKPYEVAIEDSSSFDNKVEILWILENLVCSISSAVNPWFFDKCVPKAIISKLKYESSNNLFNNGNYQAQINNKGWIVFNSNDNNIYKIKANGDSLKQLTFNNISNDPKWDYTNTTIYFFKKFNDCKL